MTARHGSRSRGFEGVLQHRGDELLLMALTPFGSKAFVLRQQGVDVEYTPHAVREQDLPFPPEYILLDVHRTLFIGIPGAPLPDGVHTHDRAGERITEHWSEGRLMRRQFRRLSGGPEGVIQITYRGGMVPGGVPPTIEVENGWFGYGLAIETLEFRPLSPDQGSARSASLAGS